MNVTEYTQPVAGCAAPPQNPHGCSMAYLQLFQRFVIRRGIAPLKVRVKTEPPHLQKTDLGDPGRIRTVPSALERRAISPEIDGAIGRARAVRRADNPEPDDGVAPSWAAYGAALVLDTIRRKSDAGRNRTFFLGSNRPLLGH